MVFIGRLLSTVSRCVARSADAQRQSGSERELLDAASSARATQLGVTPELEALPASALELATCGSAVLVDAARMRTRFGTQVDACAVVPRSEAHLPEMTGLGRVEQVRSPRAPPADQVFCRDQDAPVFTCSAARSALEAVELIHCAERATQSWSRHARALASAARTF
jgi:hypothetical protein